MDIINEKHAGVAASFGIMAPSAPVKTKHPEECNKITVFWRQETRQKYE